MNRVRMNRTLNRARGYISPTEADLMCPYFKERFIEWGAMDKVAICELTDENIECHYRNAQPDGTPLCYRYDYIPYDIIEDVDPVPTGLADIPYILIDPAARVYFSKQYVDTHQKIWRIKDNVLGWYLEV